MKLEKLIEARKAKNWSQKKLASEMHITQQAISNWENGTSSPSIVDLVMLSQILNVSIDYLLNNKANDYYLVTKSEYKTLMKVKDVLESMEKRRTESQQITIENSDVTIVQGTYNKN